MQSSQLAARVKEVVDVESTMDHPIGYRSLEDRSRVRLGNRTRPMVCWKHSSGLSGLEFELSPVGGMGEIFSLGPEDWT